MLLEDTSLKILTTILYFSLKNVWNGRTFDKLTSDQLLFHSLPGPRTNEIRELLSTACSKWEQVVSIGNLLLI